MIIISMMHSMMMIARTSLTMMNQMIWMVTLMCVGLLDRLIIMYRQTLSFTMTRSSAGGPGDGDSDICERAVPLAPVQFGSDSQ